MTGVADRRVSFRVSALAFVLMTAVVAGLATGVLVLLDPRAQAFWGAQLGDLGTFLRTLLPR